MRDRRWQGDRRSKRYRSNARDVPVSRAARGDPGDVDYLGKLLPRIRLRGRLLAHNLDMVPDYVNAVTTSPEMETILNLGRGVIGYSQEALTGITRSSSQTKISVAGARTILAISGQRRRGVFNQADPTRRRRPDR